MNFSSIDKLKSDYDKNFVSYWSKAFNEFNSDSFDNSVWFTGPTSYLFKLCGTRFAVDLQIRREQELAKLSHSLLKDCSKIPFVLITHQHGDHMCTPLMRLLKDTDIRWYIPKGTKEKYLLASEIKPENIIFVQDGDEFTEGNIKIRAFYSPHAKKGEETFLQCGYHIYCESSNILIPGDVRDYDYDGYPEFSDIDYTFTHLWAGKDSIDEQKYMPMLEKFADYYSRLNSKNYILCHLYEIGREKASMWTSMHAKIAKDMINKRLPQSDVTVPYLSDRYNLERKK